MSDEEKKVIEEVKDVIEYDKEHRIVTMYDKQPLFRDKLQILLNLIEKQQKELEELKDIQQQICNEELISQEYVKENYISKDKIKAKIEELKDGTYDAKIVLQSLLEKK